MKTDELTSGALEEIPAAREKLKHFIRSFRPLLLWGLFSVLLLFWDAYRKTTLTFVLSPDLGELGEPQITLDGAPFRPGNRIKPGSHVIRISGRGFETVEKRLSLWVGANDIGNVEIQRSRGDLTVASWPIPPNRVHIKGPDYESKKENANSFSGVPTGEYTVTGDFGLVSEKKVVRIGPGNNELSFRPSVGWLAISANHLPAECTIQGGRGESQAATLPLAPLLVQAGEYNLVTTRNDHRQSSRALVAVGETNTVRVEFPFSELRVGSTPEAAEVRMNGRVVGVTPFTNNEVVPGRYSMEIVKKGFESALLSFTIAERQNVSDFYEPY